MNPRTTPDGEMVRAEALPQADARSLVDSERLEAEVWSACIAGAIPRRSYVETIEAAGLHVREVRKNDYNFISDRARQACSTYEVESVSLLARKET